MSKFRLDGKTALVTGGSKGIGFGIATSLAEAGAHLSLVARNENDLEHARSQIKELSPNTIVHVYPFDITQIDSITDLFSQIS